MFQAGIEKIGGWSEFETCFGVEGGNLIPKAFLDHVVGSRTDRLQQILGGIELVRDDARLKTMVQFLCDGRVSVKKFDVFLQPFLPEDFRRFKLGQFRCKLPNLYPGTTGSK